MKIILIEAIMLYCSICIFFPNESFCDSLKISLKENSNSFNNNSYQSYQSGDFLSFSVGNFFVVKKDVIFEEVDLNINLSGLSNGLYLNLGGYYFNSGSSKLSGNVNSGFGMDLSDKTIFTFLGVGCFINRNFIGYDIMLRVNYKISQSIFLGIDSKFLFYTPIIASDNKNEKGLLIGMNLAYRYNY